MPTIMHSLIAFIEPRSGGALVLMKANKRRLPILLVVIYKNLKFCSQGGVPRRLKVDRCCSLCFLSSALDTYHQPMTNIPQNEVSSETCPVSSSEGPLMCSTCLQKDSETGLGLL